jgi:hypothetical protein
MTDDSERAPDGRDEAQSVDLGEPERIERGGPQEDVEPPDLDERQRRIRPERRPAGPPLEETPREERRGAERTEPPVDPEE